MRGGFGAGVGSSYPHVEKFQGDLLDRRGVGSGMKRVAWAAMLVAVAMAVGCATLPREGGVAVNLVSVTPQQASFFETSATLTLRFTNESPLPVELAGSTHRIFVNGTYVGRAVTSERLALPRLGTMTQTITAYLENLPLLRKAQELGDVPSVDYRIESRLLRADGNGELGAVTTGQLDLGGLMRQAGVAPVRGGGG